MHRIQQMGDVLLVKQLFTYLIQQPREKVNSSELPTLDSESLVLVIQELLFTNSQVTKPCLDALLKIMLDTDTHGSRLTGLLCELALRLCIDNQLTVLKVSGKEAVQLFLSCQDRI